MLGPSISHPVKPKQLEHIAGHLRLRLGVGRLNLLLGRRVLKAQGGALRAR